MDFHIFMRSDQWYLRLSRCFTEMGGDKSHSRVIHINSWGNSGMKQWMTTRIEGEVLSSISYHINLI